MSRDRNEQLINVVAPYEYREIDKEFEILNWITNRLRDLERVPSSNRKDALKSLLTNELAQPGHILTLYDGTTKCSATIKNLEKTIALQKNELFELKQKLETVNCKSLTWSESSAVPENTGCLKHSLFIILIGITILIVFVLITIHNNKILS